MEFKNNILYISTLCSPRVFNYLFRTSIKKPGQAVQKFHRLIVEGLAVNNQSCIIETLSSIPVISTGHRKRIWNIKSEVIENIQFNYIPTINLPIIKNVIVSFYSFIKISLWNLSKKRKDKIVICDVLNLTITISALLACKLTGIKVIAIITDLPGLMIASPQEKKIFENTIYKLLVSYLLSKFNGYILLTEQMNEVVNLKHKPYIVIEGSVNIKMEATHNLIENKAREKIIIYAGAIYEKYGVKNLIEAFMLLKEDNLRLHIYGSGEMEKDMYYYMNSDYRIHFKGNINNNIVVENQLAATLLVNPRFSNEVFTKYSFPSKNMEYMVSGTPLVTTPLPGMPKEYNDFVYIFDDESIDGIYKTLKFILSKPKEELHSFGLMAKNFVLSEKSNIKQSYKILQFINKL